MTSVHLAEDGSARFSFEENAPLGHEVVYALQLGGTALPQLRNFRFAATALQHSEDPHDTLIRESINERFLQDTYDHRLSAPAFTGTRRIIGWLSRAPYEELQDFCLWNGFYAKQLESSVGRDTLQVQSAVRAKAELLTNEGCLPKHALSAFDEALTRIPGLQTMDSFLSGAVQADALYSDSIITVANLYLIRSDTDGVGPELINTAFHEYMHASGELSGSGFLESSRLLEETIVAHTTEVASSRGLDPNVINPTERAKRRIDMGTYPQEREFLAMTLEQSKDEIGMEELTAAFYDECPYPKSPHMSLLKSLDRTIKGLLPRYRRTGIRGLCGEYEHHFRSGQRRQFMRKLLESTGEVLNNGL